MALEFRLFPEPDAADSLTSGAAPEQVPCRARLSDGDTTLVEGGFPFVPLGTELLMALQVLGAGEEAEILLDSGPVTLVPGGGRGLGADVRITKADGTVATARMGDLREAVISGLQAFFEETREKVPDLATTGVFEELEARAGEFAKEEVE